MNREANVFVFGTKAVQFVQCR